MCHENNNCVGLKRHYPLHIGHCNQTHQYRIEQWNDGSGLGTGSAGYVVRIFRTPDSRNDF